MSMLDPARLFAQIAKDIPAPMHKHILVIGSLATAYYFKDQLANHAVNTKDADLIVHPAGNTESCRQTAQELLNIGWRRIDRCQPKSSPEPATSLEAIRLHPPDSKAYFIEFLNLPSESQTIPKDWIPIEINGGWYGLPSFRFLRVVTWNKMRSDEGLDYAAPEMMALANLLAHPKVGPERIEFGDLKDMLRSVKDLARVLAIAHLAGRSAVEKWIDPWYTSCVSCYPKDGPSLLVSLSGGLNQVISDTYLVGQAKKANDNGLLANKNVSIQDLKEAGRRLISDVLEPLANRVRQT
jgi:hypothetical protein